MAGAGSAKTGLGAHVLVFESLLLQLRTWPGVALREDIGEDERDGHGDTLERHTTDYGMT